MRIGISETLRRTVDLPQLGNKWESPYLEFYMRDNLDYSWQSKLKIGDYVLDDLYVNLSLIKFRCKVLDIFIEPGKTIGYKIDSPWLNGYRYSWEISKP